MYCIPSIIQSLHFLSRTKPVTNEREIESRLKEHYPILNEPGLISQIKQFGRIVDVQKDEIIMDYNSPLRYVPLITSGCIKVRRITEQGKELLLYYLQKGETCAMSYSCCMSNKKSAISTISASPASFIAVPVYKVDEWIISFQSWKNYLLKNYENKMHDMLRVIDQLAFCSAEERLIKYLNKQSLMFDEMKLDITHQEIATDLNIARESVSRALKKLEKKGMLSLERNSIHLFHAIPTFA